MLKRFAVDAEQLEAQLLLFHVEQLSFHGAIAAAVFG
jgi:hypothetical protein